MAAANRVAITGIGIVSPLGNDTETSWQQLLNGKSGIAQIRNFDASSFPTTIAAEVKNFTPCAKVSPKIRKFAVRFTEFAFSAAEQALEDAGLRPQTHDPKRWGLVVGSGMMTAEFEYWLRFQEKLANAETLDLEKMRTAGKEFYSLGDFGKTVINSCLALLLKNYGIEGYATSVHTACASGGQALGLAMQSIRRGEVDYMLAGGYDSMINPVGVASFCLLGALSTYNDTPTTASRPFDASRNGFVLGEGSAFLVLENWQKAKARGAKIYAELAGEGNSLSAYRITDSHPSGDGAIQAIQAALRDAGVKPQEVNYINAHGTSTKMNDLSETNAIKAVFAEHANQIPVSSSKSLTGHLIAAAGALEAAITALAIYHSKIPMTANLTMPDIECDLDYVTEGVRNLTVKVAISNSFGFGGSNSCLLFKHPEFEGAQ